MRYLMMIIALASCAKSLEDLAPYRCAKDHTCPDGLACNDDLCTAAQIGSRCDITTDCSVAGDVICYVGGVHEVLDGDGAGVCRLSCNNDTGCPMGTKCTVDHDRGTCVDDCTESTTCTVGVCTPRRFDGISLCIPGGNGFAACSSVEATLCMSRVCGGGANMTLSCPSLGINCPTNGTCDVGRCGCAPGYERRGCDGAACGQTGCTYPEYSCEPIGSLNPPTCQQANQYVQGTCKCVDGRQLPFSCGSTASCEEMCR